MKKVILLIALLWGGALCAQNPFEKEILQSKLCYRLYSDE